MDAEATFVRRERCERGRAADVGDPRAGRDPLRDLGDGGVRNGQDDELRVRVRFTAGADGQATLGQPSGDRATRSLNVETTGTRTDTDCAFRTKHGEITLNGNPNIAFTGSLNIVNGVLSGPQTATHKGSFTWARTGGSGTCDVDLTSTYDPGTHTATVTGTFCGVDVNVTRNR